ncbi:MAG: carboxypeptidase-like regulatory domain-containing protein, partial [Bacteroidales bacterium]|nr:carboxypeptidase-like regulatory domain-containing protein [Bacteroidales bacterium]
MSKALRFFAILSLLLPLGLRSFEASAQQSNRITVTTVVKDNVGALPGVGVVVKGTTNGTMTDENGSATLNNVPANGTIVVSYLGYTTVEVPVNGRAQIAVTMEEDALALEETVVVGYGVQKKVNLTGSVSAVDFDKVATKSRPIVNASQALTDASPGLQVMQGRGMPGDEAISMNIRGIGTLNSSGPLVLVDGIEQGINSVNPADIANVSILKDAASCAIYGNRGANGVILVTTKNGSKDGKISVEYNGNFAYSEPFKVIHTVENYVDYMNLFNEARDNTGRAHIY